MLKNVPWGWMALLVAAFAVLVLLFGYVLPPLNDWIYAVTVVAVMVVFVLLLAKAGK